MNLRNKNGSITIFVLVGLLFMASFLIIMFSGNINKSKIVKEQIDIIKSIYGKNTDKESTNNIYNSLVPIITIKKSDTDSFMGIEIESNTEIKEVIYRIDGIEKNSPEEFYQHINDNVADGEEKEVTIKVEDKEGNIVEVTETIKFVKPTINKLPSPIILGTTQLDDSYVTYDEYGGVKEETYIIVAFPETTYSSMTDLVSFANQWLLDNNQYEVDADVKVIAKGNNNLIAESTQTITFKKPLEPVIGVIPSQIVTNITSVSESYVTYDDKGKKEETYKILEVPEETFDTMTEVVKYADKWLLDNKQYEVDVNIQIVAKGNNNLTSESTQQIKFMRGVQIASETDLINALYSTTPSYIKVETSNGNNEIVCNSPITLDGVSHKLDLNGNTISYTVNSAAEGSTLKFLTLGPNANLTVMDSTEEGKGGIVFNVLEEVTSDGKDRKTKAITVDNQGVVNVESGIIEVNISRKMGNDKKKDGNVHDTGVAIENSGTVNLNGGTILTNVVTQSCSYLTIQISEAVAKGIVNNGTINVTSGTINTNAEAYAVRASGAIWKGETEAYAYGIENNGTINNSENITFSTTATAHKENSRNQEEEALDIK